MRMINFFLLSGIILVFVGCSRQIHLSGPPAVSLNAYGEMWNRNSTGFKTIDLTTPDVYVRITDLNNGTISGFTLTNSTLKANYSGTYSLNAGITLYTNLASEIGAKIYKNNVGQNNCYTHFHTPASSNDGFFSINCLLNLNSGDNISLWLDDHSNPVNDPVLINTNLVIIKIE